MHIKFNNKPQKAKYSTDLRTLTVDSYSRNNRKRQFITCPSVSIIFLLSHIYDGLAQQETCPSCCQMSSWDIIQHMFPISPCSRITD